MSERSVEPYDLGGMGGHVEAPHVINRVDAVTAAVIHGALESIAVESSRTGSPAGSATTASACRR